MYGRLEFARPTAVVRDAYRRQVVGAAMSDELSRRTVVRALAGGSLALAGCSAFDAESDGSTTEAASETARTLAARFAPTLYFDDREPWFPTDPRPYASERDGEAVVDGFDALDGYHERFDGDDPPDPTVFYHVVEYDDSPLAVVQYWFYSAFDQFSVNFHWHDWEVLHVFVDTESGDPQLYVASSHARKVPNNEFLDPSPDVVPRVLSELGSHSSALSLNADASQFERFAVGDLFADVTNAAIEGVPDLSELPLAYGLPRDEGGRLPYLVPEYDGAPIYDHERLPAVSRDSLVPADVTVRSFDALASPPVGLPTRETGVTFQHRERDGDADVDYALVPTSEVEHLAFTGSQLSYEFAVPAVAEDAVASHLTTTDAPWTQERYTDPASDVSDPSHRRALADRYDAVGDPAPANAVVARVTQVTTADDAPENAGVTTTESSVEAATLLESDPTVVPTFRGVAAVRDVPAGDHRLTVNGAGRAPHSERVVVADAAGTTAAGVDGEIPLVARERATKLEVAGENADVDLARVAVEDDFAGRLYDAPTDGDDAVYVHDGGAYTTEIRDADDAIGAYRVTPDPNAREAVRIENPRTGKASLASFLATISEETRADVAAVAGDAGGGDAAGDDSPAGDATADGSRGTATPAERTAADSGSTSGGRDAATGSENAVNGLTRALAAVVDAARRAAERAREGDRANADKQLAVVADRLRRAAERLAAASDDLSDPLSNAVDSRVRQAKTRTEQARNARKL